MGWLLPAVIATLSSTLILVGVYIYLFFHEGRSYHLGVWSLSWAVYALRFVFQTWELLGGSSLLLEIGYQVAALLSGFILMWGTYIFIGRRMPRGWLLGTLLGTAWIIIAAVSQVPFLVLTAPTFTLLAAIFIWTGWMFRRLTGVGRFSKELAGWVFILWGVHKLDFPILRPIEWFAPWGYLIGAMLSLLAAMGLLLIYFDKTRRQLVESETRFRLLFENVPVAYQSLDARGFIQNVNHTWLDELGYQLEEVIGQPFHTLLTPASASLIEDKFKNIGSCDLAETELEVVTKSGAILIMNVTGRVVTDEHGNPVQTHCVLHNVTARKEAAEALRQKDELLRSVVTGAPVALFAVDNQGFVTLTTGQGFNGLDRQVENMVGQSFFDHNAHLPQLTSALMRTLHGEPASTIVDLEGEIYDIHLTPLHSEGDLTTGAIGVAHNITGRMAAEKSLQRQIHRLAALHTIDEAISSSFDLQLTMNIMLEQVIAHLNVDAADVLALHPNTQELVLIAAQGFRHKGGGITSIRNGDGYSGLVALTRQPTYLPDLTGIHSPNLPIPSIWSQEGFKAYYGLPLLAKGQVKGVLEIFHRSELDSDQEWLDFLITLAGQAAIAIDNANMFDELQRSNLELMLAYDTTLEGWARALELRDKETEGHSQRVTDITLRLARQMGIASVELVHVRRGALLHDIGKMAIPDSILQKPGPLSDEEWRIMRLHPVYAYELLSPIAYLRPALEIPYCHHEKWDGTGYPRGLAGEQIPLAARIFAVVDVWDALLSDRPYRPAWPQDQVYAYLRDQAGMHFDPRVVEFFEALIEKGL